MIKRETLWMRYVNFEKVKDMLHLVNDNNGKLSAGKLEQLGITKKVLVKDNGQPMTHSPQYHYRKVMENLNLIEVKQRLYYISRDRRVSDFLTLSTFKKTMSFEAKEILREIIVKNDSCRRYFFDVFMEKNFYTLENLRKEGRYIFVVTKSMGNSFYEERKERQTTEKNIHKKKKAGAVILKNPIGKAIELKTQDEIHAIYWGVRLWALDLEITNEIITNFIEGRIIYPVNQDFSEQVLTNILLDKINKSDSEWLLIHIPTFIKEVALSTRFSINKIKAFLSKIKHDYPASAMFIPSSTVFIDIKTPFEKQDLAIRNLYLEQRNGYISHLRLRKDILKEVLL